MFLKIIWPELQNCIFLESFNNIYSSTNILSQSCLGDMLTVIGL